MPTKVIVVFVNAAAASVVPVQHALLLKIAAGVVLFSPPMLRGDNGLHEARQQGLA